MTPTTPFVPDVPGRGAWRRTGGLLPVTPGASSSAGYYRLARTGEVPVGSGYARGRDTSDSARCVHLGVKAIQRLAMLPPAQVDGWFGPVTDTAVRSWQTRLGVLSDGIVGPVTMRAALGPLIHAAAANHGVPTRYLGGIVAHESAFDPAAVGVNGYDHGLVQINLDAHRSITVEQALDPWWALPWSAVALAAVHTRWQGKTAGGVDPWHVAVLSHNSPANAARLAAEGRYPSQQAADYVAAIIAAWTA